MLESTSRLMICVADTSRCQGCFCLFKLPLLLLLLLLLLQDCVDFCYRAYTDNILECAPPPVAFCHLFIYCVVVAVVVILYDLAGFASIWNRSIKMRFRRSTSGRWQSTTKRK